MHLIDIVLRCGLLAALMVAAGGHATTARTAAADPARAHSADPEGLLSTSPALPLDRFATLEGVLPGLLDKRAIFIGERHTRYDHHLIQLEVIRRLHERDRTVAVGMEMFQQPFQTAIDDYLAGGIGLNELLRETEYYQRWRVDFRHYAPILEYAREHDLPVIALNVPTELTRAVGQGGFKGLSGEQRQQLPAEIEPAGTAYRERIRTVFDKHPQDGERRFEHFLEAQLLWDEAMAARAAAYLDAHPDHQLVILAGNQHIAWGDSIPQRLQRRLAVPAVSLLNSWDGPIRPGLADYLLMPAERALPRAGRLGVRLKERDGSVIIDACEQESACARADLRAGDRISAINDMPVASVADLRVELWDKQPGDTIGLDMRRDRLLLPDRDFSVQVTLQ